MGGFWSSVDVSNVGSKDIGSSVSIMASSGVGLTRFSTKKGALWGSGEISMDSMPGPGEEEGGGGVESVSRI